MYIGLQIPSFKYPGGTTIIGSRLKEIVQVAEGIGFHSLWVMDHFYQIEGLFGESYQDPMLEAYTTLGYFAAMTENILLGCLVSGVIYRHPSVLLKEVTTLDVLSGGRAYFGLGAAWYEDEAKGFGIAYPPTSERFEQLEDVLQLAHELWKSDRISFKSRHFDIPALTNNPAPISQPRPRIMVGGMGANKTMRFVAQYGDACNLFEGAGLKQVQEAIDNLKRHCDNLGRDYNTIEKTSLGEVTLTPHRDTIQGLIKRATDLKKMGINHVIFNMTNVYETALLENVAKELIAAVLTL